MNPFRRAPGERGGIAGGEGRAILLVLAGAVLAVVALTVGAVLAPAESLGGRPNSTPARIVGGLALVVAPALPVAAGLAARRTGGLPVWPVLGIVFAVPVAAVSVMLALQA